MCYFDEQKYILCLSLIYLVPCFGKGGGGYPESQSDSFAIDGPLHEILVLFV